jgi:hypothetical protein
LRVNALANEKVGDYLNTYFVSSYQKVGTFRVVDGQKQGGNVASYFCTPDGQVLHVVTGPVSAATLLREARWAVETHKLGLLECRESENRLKGFFRKAHSNRLLLEHSYDIRATASRSNRPSLTGQGRVHRVLALYPLLKIEQVYKYVFEKVLDEKISTAPVEETNR